MKGLSNALHAMGLEGEGTTEDDLWEAGGREAIGGHLRELIDRELERKEAEFGDEWALVERLVLLRTIDTLWVEHLTELDDMRRGIGLRGYAQQDPLNEFRKEAFALYEELRSLIRHGVASTIFRVTVIRQSPSQPVGVPAGAGSGATGAGIAAAGSSTAAGGSGAVVRTSGGAGPDAATSANLAAGVAAARGLARGGSTGPSAGTAGARTAGATGGATGGRGAAADPSGGVARGLPAPPSAMRRMQESLGDQPIASSPSSGLRPGYTPSGQRIGRNDPCFCGSGLKYKKCHGR
jgi:preprotein translocase subunit SecA